MGTFRAEERTFSRSRHKLSSSPRGAGIYPAGQFRACDDRLEAIAGYFRFEGFDRLGSTDYKWLITDTKPRCLQLVVASCVCFLGFCFFSSEEDLVCTVSILRRFLGRRRIKISRRSFLSLRRDNSAFVRN